MKSSPPGRGAFHDYYREIFGDRWNALTEAMSSGGIEKCTISLNSEVYHLDCASIVAASAAGPVENARALDMCAAPGGKTLVLASTLGPDGSILANDRSSARGARLKRVLDKHLPESLRVQVATSGRDARRFGICEPERYDIVLADVPCNSEAHLLQGSGRIDRWSRSRVKRIASDAFAILRSATQTARIGGRIVYATCSLTPDENELLVERAIERGRKKGPMIKPHPLPEHLASTAHAFGIRIETSGFGFRIWPDRNGGRGPIFFSILERLPDGHSDAHHMNNNRATQGSTEEDEA